ncbi:low affinity immunoglobulin gamma Fc region receptor III-A [Sorex araneus]|uniref:low affinity immunoglobulin gamma Fc region receptor III-A n=1 Tax=Sorex araneus TaxID=42254 RepID=UPI0024338160|nr:low affinity immunoglobulin gamma Fc region receptor III-A [Sorex araneus]
MWRLLGPMALLLLAPCHTLADLPKAVVTLDPPWDRVLEKDHVTLTCQGPGGPGHSVTHWWLNGSALATQQEASLTLASARMADSGQYSCKTALSARSDPQSLEVHQGWLLLQAQRWVVRIGDPIRLRCHSWRNRSVHSVIYFHNGRGRQFSYQNMELLIPAAKLTDSGTYFCRGLFGRVRNESSATARLLVEDPSRPLYSPSIPSPFLPSPSLAVGLLYVASTGLCLSVWLDLRRLLVAARWNEKMRWCRDPPDK